MTPILFIGQVQGPQHPHNMTERREMEVEEDYPAQLDWDQGDGLDLGSWSLGENNVPLLTIEEELKYY